MFEPSINTEGNYNYRVDLWSLGVLIYFLCTQELPFDNPNLERKIINVSYNMEIDIPEDFKILICKLLQKEPKNRITCNDIKKLPFLKDHFNAYEKGNLLQL